MALALWAAKSLNREAASTRVAGDDAASIRRIKLTPTIRKIVVPTDFSPRSDAAVDYAVALATALGAPVHLVHVVEEPFLGGEWEMYIRNPQEIREQLDADARARLAATAGRLETLSIPVSTGIRHGSAFEGIVHEAKAVSADLIVMGTHGRRGVSHLMLGSVAERVIPRSALSGSCRSHDSGGSASGGRCGAQRRLTRH